MILQTGVVNPGLALHEANGGAAGVLLHGAPTESHSGVRTTVFRQSDGTEITDAVVIPVKGQRAYLQVYRQVDVTAKRVEMFRQNGQLEHPKDKDGKEIKYFERQVATAGLWDSQTGAWIKKLPEIGWGLFRSNHDGTLVIGSSATVVIETGEVLPGVASLSDDGTLGVVTTTVTEPGSDTARRGSNVIDPRTGVSLACAPALGSLVWQPGGVRLAGIDSGRLGVIDLFGTPAPGAVDLAELAHTSRWAKAMAAAAAATEGVESQLRTIVLDHVQSTTARRRAFHVLEWRAHRGSAAATGILAGLSTDDPQVANWRADRAARIRAASGLVE